MEMELGKLITELSMRMRLLRTTQENGDQAGELSERDILLLELLDGKGRMTVSEIMAACPQVSESTISTNITKLWRERKLVSKQVNRDNQRITHVELTEKGKTVLAIMRRQRAERFARLLGAMKITDDERRVLESVTARAISYFDQYLGLKPNGSQPEEKEILIQAREGM